MIVARLLLDGGLLGMLAVISNLRTKTASLTYSTDPPGKIVGRHKLSTNRKFLTWLSFLSLVKDTVKTGN